METIKHAIPIIVVINSDLKAKSSLNPCFSLDFDDSF
jgi:hypothetical protein